MALRLTNTSQHIGKSGDTDWWEWAAYLGGDERELDEVAYVEYHLHPSFPNPIRRVKKRKDGFLLTAKGWGVFELRAKVVFNSDKKPRILKHSLEFEVSTHDG